LHFRKQVSVSGGDQLPPEFHGIVGSHRLELSRLQNSEQLNLNLLMDLSHLIKKDDAARIALGEPPRAILGAVESCLAVPKQFRLDQSGGEGGKVHRHEELLEVGLEFPIAPATSSFAVPEGPQISVGIWYMRTCSQK
jgi:hypothetical protein